MYLKPNFDERRAVAELCSEQVNPLVMAETECSTPDTVQNDDFHLGRVW